MNKSHLVYSSLPPCSAHTIQRDTVSAILNAAGGGDAILSIVCQTIPITKPFDRKEIVKFLVSHGLLLSVVPSKSISDKDIRWETYNLQYSKELYRTPLDISLCKCAHANCLAGITNKKLIQAICVFKNNDCWKWGEHSPIGRFPININLNKLINVVLKCAF